MFGPGFQRDGTPGLFHPDRFRFGEAVHLSPLLRAALGVPGVHDVRVTTFRRAGREDGGLALGLGRIDLGGFEIARLDNDPTFPEHGTFEVNLEGGA